MKFDPRRIAVEYYFGYLQYWKLPRIAADALEEGYDGPALRRLAGRANQSCVDMCAEDLSASEIDSAFREMGIGAPIAKDSARILLATECVQTALDGQSNVFDSATHIRIHLCELSDPPEPLRRIVNLSKEASNAPRSQWSRLESDLRNAFTDFLTSTQ
jgi:hypothetical protein